MAEASQLPILPPELCDLIIDNAHADRNLLAVMGLVCKGWLTSSRSHLFGSIEIESNTSISFLDLLRSQNHSFSSHVHRLKLSDAQWPPSTFNGTLWDKMLPRLPESLREPIISLHIRSESWLAREFMLANDLSFLLPHLTELHMDYVKFDSMSQLMNILSTLTNLERLSLRVSFATYEPIGSTAFAQALYSPPPHLQSIQLDVGRTRSRSLNQPQIFRILGWSLTGSPPPKISRLCLTNIALEDLMYLNTSKILPKLAGSLQELELILDANDTANAGLVNPDLSCSDNDRLHSLSFGGLQWNHQGMLGLPYRLLESINHPLRYLSISANLADSDGILSYDLNGKAMVQILKSPQFAQLETLEFHLRHPRRSGVESMADVKEYIEESLSELLAQGVLQVFKYW